MGFQLWVEITAGPFSEIEVEIIDGCQSDCVPIASEEHTSHEEEAILSNGSVEVVIRPGEVISTIQVGDKIKDVNTTLWTYIAQNPQTNSGLYVFNPKLYPQ